MKTVALIFIAVLLLTGCLWNIRAEVLLRLNGGAYRIEVTAWVWYARFALRFCMQGEILGLPDALRARFAHKRRKKRKRTFRYEAGMLRVRALSCSGSVAPGDAAAAALAAGALQILADALRAPAGIPAAGRILPDFSGRGCRIKVEGIVVLNTMQIMSAALRRQKKKKGERFYAASDRKHPANLHGTAQ